MALLIAALLRFWQLDQFPSGLYRDEAFNGLDALQVLKGNHALFFPANNGREPLYIYLTAIAVAIWGETTFAVRVAAALVGTLTTIPIYLLGRIWFGWQPAVLAALIWAITLWPVHLSRIGLRAGLIVPVMALAFWLVTKAYRRQKEWLWGLAGLIYGLGFYTYLAFRFTPLLLLALIVYLILTGRARRLWPGLIWFLIGSTIALLPLAVLIWQQPDIFSGRSGQVSIMHPDVYEDSILQTLGRNIWAATGMFLWRGDTILRHNPSGRPVFDPLLIVPFILGLLWCLRHWRRPPAATVLLWLVIMLGPTILAADAPHFLRAAGVLPAAMLLPALGLSWIWQWYRFPSWAGALLVAALLAGSLVWTIRDYRAYVADPDVSYAFEAAATHLAEELNSEPSEVDVYLDDRLWTSWPSLSFLVGDKALLGDEARIVRYLAAGDLPDKVQKPSAIYAWPYDSLDFIPGLVEQPALIAVQDGPLTRGDFEEDAYPLFVRFGIDAASTVDPQRKASFADQVYLHEVNVTQLDPSTLQVDIYWSVVGELDNDLVVFVHVTGADGLIGQDDRSLGGDRWLAAWWQPENRLLESHTIMLNEAFDNNQHQITIGLYEGGSGARLPVTDMISGEDLGTAWTVPGE